jgi:hypothetical protein
MRLEVVGEGPDLGLDVAVDAEATLVGRYELRLGESGCRQEEAHEDERGSSAASQIREEGAHEPGHCNLLRNRDR